MSNEKKPQPARDDVSTKTGESSRIEDAERQKQGEVRRAKRNKLEIGKQAEG